MSGACFCDPILANANLDALTVIALSAESPRRSFATLFEKDNTCFNALYVRASGGNGAAQ